MLFGPKCPVTQDEWDWLLAGFKWLDKEFGADSDRAHGLILPETEFFPSVSADPKQRARDMLDQVKYLCDMKDWPTKLVTGEKSRDASIQPGFALQHEQHAPLGHFHLVENKDGSYIGEVAYNPSQINDAIGMVATLSHELSHYLMAYASSVMPGGHDMMEHATDLCAVYLGFGIFLANNARSFDTISEFDQIGWESRAAGYLSESALISALVINEQLCGRDPMLASPYLKNYLRKDLAKAHKYAAKKNLKQDLANIDLFEYGVTAYADQRQMPEKS